MANYLYEKFKKLENDTTNDRLQVQRNINERLGGMTLVPLTRAEYTALTPKDSSTVYLVADSNTYSLYVGDIQISGSGGDGIIKVKNALVLEERTTAPANKLSREGSAYGVNSHTELYQPTMTHTTHIYDGGAPSRFIPAAGSNRYIILDSNGHVSESRVSDGYSKLTVQIERGGAQETLTYSVRTGRIETVLYNVGLSNYQLRDYISYFIDCSRQVGNVTKSWMYTGRFNGLYSGALPDAPALTTDGYSIASCPYSGYITSYYKVNFPTLTLGFYADELLDFYSAVPKLVLEIAYEDVSGTEITEAGSLVTYALTESGDPGNQLGLLYDPDTADLFSDEPHLYSPPTGKYLQVAKIAALGQTEVIG